MSNTNPRRTALVTGASYGLGAAIAIALAREGCDVAVSDLRTDDLADTLKQIEAVGTRACAVALDLRVQASIEQAMADVVATCGQLDVLVNNAGVTLRRTALDVTPSDWDEVVGTNLKGTFFMSQQMGRHLVATGRPGCIVSLASTHGVVGYAQRSTYGISKGGIVQMTRMLAVEWAEHGIRVNAVAPGTADTPSRAAYFEANPDARAAMTERIPLRRFADPAEIAGAVCYLASPQAAYVTGQTLLIDGGLTSY
jgi:NAD(P)-dependent dehydrogenase (short-subunit alcohol dehydrogenase family)